MDGLGDANANEFRWRDDIPSLLPAPIRYTDLLSRRGCGTRDSARESTLETLDRDWRDGDTTGEQKWPMVLHEALDVRASSLIWAERSSSVGSLAWTYEGSEPGHVPSQLFGVSGA